MIDFKLFLYDSTKENYRGEDFSDYVLQGGEIAFDLTQELDTAEVTLCGITRAIAFEPTTKFIFVVNGIEKHFCVANDTVEQPILTDNEYFTHHISFIEPSVIAQKRLVDNISVTYKLKDVNLKQTYAFANQGLNIKTYDTKFTPHENFGSKWEDALFKDEHLTYSTGKYFKFDMPDYNITYTSSDNQVVNTNNMYMSADNIKGGTIKIRIPNLKIFKAVEGTKDYTDIGFASIDYSILEDGKLVKSGSIISNSNLLKDPIHYENRNEQEGGTDIGNRRHYEVIDVWGTAGVQTGTRPNEPYFYLKGGYVITKGEWLLEDIGNTGRFFDLYYRKYTDILNGKTITEGSYSEVEIAVKQDKKYEVVISLHSFSEQPSSTSGLNDFFKVYATTNNKINGYLKIYTATYSESAYEPRIRITKTTNQIPLDYLKYNYDFVTRTTSSTKTLYTSSNPYSCYELIQKAIYNSGTYTEDDVLPFYIDTAFVDELLKTQVIENFYNQKNLWEILVEVGYYIHSIPEIRFGEDDRFMITFNRLGRTDLQNDSSQTISIFNSKSIEDYVSSTSSYISNMVQLGGEITEIIHPKTISDTYLIDNDTACLITTYPIIELLNITIIDSNGNERDFTRFVYEENIYKILGINVGEDPNRGIALYYRLGEKRILGGDYQVPRTNNDIYSDYAFKKCIYSAFYGYPTSLSSSTSETYWKNIKVNDYKFEITYRTKGNARQTHTRPDLRKFLVSTKHENIPIQQQFNNQQDTLVDSVKFGNNMYGKLLKTGNIAYTIKEWTDNVATLKNVGDLFKINNELYYVSKVTNQYYSDHVISEVKYSKDYNELSNIIGIPSEPRFYEISEQSSINREVAINDYIILTTDTGKTNFGSNNILTLEYLETLIFGGGRFAKYALTEFIGDDGSKFILTPINAYSSGTTLSYNWKMKDNYGAGDKIITIDNTYRSLLSVPYTDRYGKVKSFKFWIADDISKYFGDTKKLPEAEEGNIQNDEVAMNLKDVGIGTKKPIMLYKDNRESISFNYNICTLTDSDRFVISPFFFTPKKKKLEVVFLKEEVNKLTNGYIDSSSIIFTEYDISNIQSFKTEYLIINSLVVGWAGGIPDNAKAIAVVYNYDKRSDKYPFVFARNIDGLDEEERNKKIYINVPNNEVLFNNKQ